MVHTLIETIAHARKDSCGDLLAPIQYETLHDPQGLHDGIKAAARILDALARGEKVAVYADFDADGIPAAVILHDVLKKIGFPEVRVYIPHRDNEGYGFHAHAVETLAKEGIQLIITVDVGIQGHEGVMVANDAGMDVIVTDHHEQGETVPPAYAVVHPARGNYPFKGLCGSGVAYKLAQLCMREARTRNLPALAEVPEGWEKWLLDMVAIATVADMVPLVDENRTLVHFGLEVLRRARRPGIQALCKKGRIQARDITEDDIGFVIAPRINAASRMDCPELAYYLLIAEDAETADRHAVELERLNAKRKGKVAAIVRAAREKVITHAHGAVAVIGDPAWSPALLGLAANSVLEGRTGVVCLWGRDGRGVLKGSCRSDGSVHVTEMFRSAKVALDEAGGHKCAGGFSVSHEMIHALEDSFIEAANHIPEDTTEVHDRCVCALADLSPRLYVELRALAPFGVGNEKPLLEFANVQVSDVRVFGKEGNHTEVMLVGPRGSIRAFEFFKTPDQFSVTPAPGSTVTIIGSLEKESFGRRGVALRIKDIH